MAEAEKEEKNRHANEHEHGTVRAGVDEAPEPLRIVVIVGDVGCVNAYVGNFDDCLSRV